MRQSRRTWKDWLDGRITVIIYTASVIAGGILALYVAPPSFAMYHSEYSMSIVNFLLAMIAFTGIIFAGIMSIYVLDTCIQHAPDPDEEKARKIEEKEREQEAARVQEWQAMQAVRAAWRRDHPVAEDFIQEPPERVEIPDELLGKTLAMEGDD
jgi:hypothetical protein